MMAKQAALFSFLTIFHHTLQNVITFIAYYLDYFHESDREKRALGILLYKISSVSV